MKTISSDNVLSRQIKRNIQRAKQKHLKQIECYQRKQEKQNKRIQKALERERAKKRREEARKQREEAKRKRQEAESDDENSSDGNLSSSSSGDSVKNERKNIWRDIKPLEGIFSLV